jgi:hypothetical protein
VAFNPIQGRGRELARVDLMQPIPSYNWAPVDPMQPVPPYNWRLSRDGSRVAFSQAERNERDRRVRVIPLAGSRAFGLTLKGQTWLNAVQWSADGKGIYVGSTPALGGGLCYVDMEGHGTDVFRQTRPPFYDGIRGVPSPDGHKIAVSGFVFYNNIWMIESF